VLHRLSLQQNSRHGERLPCLGHSIVSRAAFAEEIRPESETELRSRALESLEGGACGQT
jgi:hypothetical protein